MKAEIITALKLDVYSLLGQPVLDNLEIPVGPNTSEKFQTLFTKPLKDFLNVCSCVD